MNSKPKLIFCVFLAALTAPAAVLDCERVYGATPFEGLFISNQFAGTFGMRFTDLEFTNQFPIIVQAGSPARCFGAGSGRDDILFPTNAHDHGSFFLTDCGVDVEGGPKGFIVRFDALVSTFSCYLLDLDADEKVTLTAYSSDADTSGLATNVFYSTNAPFGEGLSGFASITNIAKQTMSTFATVLRELNFEPSRPNQGMRTEEFSKWAAERRRRQGNGDRARHH